MRPVRQGSRPHADDHRPGRRGPRDRAVRATRGGRGERVRTGPYSGRRHADACSGMRQPRQSTRDLMGEQRDVGHAGRAEHDRHGQGHQDRAPIPPARPAAARQSLVQSAGQAGPVRALTQQHCARVTDQTLSARADNQPLIPPATLTHQEGAPYSAVDMDSTPTSLQVRRTFLYRPRCDPFCLNSRGQHRLRPPRHARPGQHLHRVTPGPGCRPGRTSVLQAILR